MADPTRTVALPDAPAVTASVADADVTTSPGSSPGLPVPSAPGTRYLMGEEIAHGGMGEVYRATDTVLGREVAVKVLQAKYGPDSGAARRFADEARITGQLQHPAIPPVHDLGTLPDGRPFLAMKLIQGETLDQMLKNRTDPSADRGRFVATFEAICQAVGYAHAHGVIHRDLKPANVMVGAFGEVQVMDWGLAKVLRAGIARDGTDADPEATATPTEVVRLRHADRALTHAGAVLGTPAFMPPEQAIGAIDQVDRRSDVFGLGGILCAVLTGGPPFQGPTAESTRQLAAKGKVAEAYARLDACGGEPEFVALCKQCLSPEPGERPADAGVVATAVAGLRAAADERARLAELERVEATERRKRRRVQRLLAAAATSLLAAVAVGAALATFWRWAEVAKDGAVSARSDAERERDAAETARREAKAAEAAEARLRAEVDRERARLAVYEYGRTVQLAYQECRDGNILSARALLAGTDARHRGWEWDCVNRLCNQELLILNTRGYVATFTPDGTQILTDGQDGTAKLWDGKTGALRRTLKGHSGAVRAAAFDRTGSRAVTASLDGTAKVWDVPTGDVVRTLSGHDGSLLCAAFHPDGTRIVTGSADNTARVWDASTGGVLHTLKAHISAVNATAFSPDGTRIVTGSADNTARVWDAVTGAELRTLAGHTGPLTAAAFSPDGTWIVTGSADGEARVWDAARGTVVRTLRGHTRGVRAAAFSRDGTRLVTGSSDGTAKIWDANTGTELNWLRGHTAVVSAVAFSDDGTAVVTAGDATARVWEVTPEPRTLRGLAGPVSFAAFDPLGKRVVTGETGGVTRLWDADSGGVLHSFPCHPRGVLCASFSGDGRSVVACGADNVARAWDAGSGVPTLTLDGKAEGIFHAAFNSDGSKLLTCGKDAVRIRDATTGAVTATFDLRSAQAAVFGAGDSRLVVRGRDDNRSTWVRVCDATTGAVVASQTLTNQRGGTHANLSADGTRLVTAYADGVARVWDVASGAELLALKGHTRGVSCASFSPDGRRIVTGGDNTARVWDAATGAELLTLKGHPVSVTTAAFSPDGKRLITCGADNEPRIWESRPRLGGRPQPLSGAK